MAELTKEHFDQQLKELVSKKDLDFRFEKQTKELKVFAKKQTEELATMVKLSFDHVDNRLDKIKKELTRKE